MDTEQAFNKLLNWINSVCHAYSVTFNQLLYKQCSDLPVKSITVMADHDCIAYSNTVEIFFTQVQDPMLHSRSMLGAQVVL